VTAYVMTQRTPPIKRIQEMDTPTVKVLIDEINRKDELIKQLRKELQKNKLDRQELEDIQKRLDQAADEVKTLTEQIIVLKAKEVPNAKPIAAAITSKQVTDALLSIQTSVQLCLGDVESRALATEGAPKDGRIDAIVRLSTTPTGTAFDVKTTSGLDFSPGARLCVEDAVRRVAYPKSSEILDIRIDIAYTMGELKMSGAVERQREPEGSNLNGI
jgi:hypothetical protein